MFAVASKSALIAAGMAAISYGGGAGEKRSASDVSNAITSGLVLSFIWLTVVDTLISLILPAA